MHGWIMLIGICIVASIMQSCNEKENNQELLLQAVEERLVQTNKLIVFENVESLDELNNKLVEPATREKALVFQPWALQINQYTSEPIKLIQDLKDGLMAVSDKALKEGRDRGNLVKRFFTEDSRLETWENAIKTYSKKIQTLHPSITSLINQTFTNELSDMAATVSKAGSIQDKNMTVYECLLRLSLIQNQIHSIEHSVLVFCNEHSEITHHPYTSFSPIIGQSSTIVKAGEEIEITAGVVTFAGYAKPSITMNGKQVSMNDEGFAVYKFNAPIKAGSYTIKARIYYTDKTGEKQQFDKLVRYTVF